MVITVFTCINRRNLEINFAFLIEISNFLSSNSLEWQILSTPLTLLTKSIKLS